MAADAGVQIVVAQDGDEVAALATFSLLYPARQQRGQLIMMDLFARQRWRSRGLGEQLMRYLAAYALQRNCIRFDWTTESSNTGAMSFYQRLGAEHVTEKVYYRLTGQALQALAGEPAQTPGSSNSPA
ncbi:GNAT family N-acetyltransferase [Paucibacter sp. Y2R2-4]|uniref:GNAT family N-acetyltransferase n=1 Tax=Paucibacter sp. Y2R2-4 TaxID=2893553 RepID=UPI0021E43C48|nr:GNAT family N-acetyltransferase [Paucibacter sp. Y2R2-4]MCV2348772.1 GNAT family N-acetyltransferase [Paucibacter sp. Y2R2-4]